MTADINGSSGIATRTLRPETGCSKLTFITWKLALKYFSILKSPDKKMINFLSTQP